MKILIVDDEKPACNNLTKKILALYPDCLVQAETSPLTALERIQDWRPSIELILKGCNTKIAVSKRSRGGLLKLLKKQQNSFFGRSLE